MHVLKVSCQAQALSIYAAGPCRGWLCGNATSNGCQAEASYASVFSTHASISNTGETLDPSIRPMLTLNILNLTGAELSLNVDKVKMQTSVGKRRRETDVDEAVAAMRRVPIGRAERDVVSLAFRDYYKVRSLSCKSPCLVI